MARLPNAVDLLESVYAVEQTPDAWVAGVARAARPFLDRGMGVRAYFVDLRGDPEPIAAWGFTSTDGAPDGHRAAWEAWRDGLPPQFQRAVHTRVPCGFGRETFGRMNPGATRRAFRLVSAPEVYGVNGIDSSGRGCVLAAFETPDSGRAKVVPDRTLWGRLSTHLATGARLVQRLDASHPEPMTAPEAVVNPDGHMAHAEGDATRKGARESLREAAIRTDRARSAAGRHDAELATDLWRAMVSGRWTLVDRWDSDGRRYYFAWPNLPSKSDRVRLSAREEHAVGLAALGRPNKLIGYEMGVTPSTVSRLLGRACEKL